MLQNHYSLASFELFYKYNTYRELSSFLTALLIALLSRVWKITSSWFFFFCFFLTFQRIDESKIKAILISNDHIRVTSSQSIVLPDFFISSFRRTLNIHEHTHRPCVEGCVKLHAFEVERVSLEVFHLAWPQAWAEVLPIYSNRSLSTPVILW